MLRKLPYGANYLNFNEMPELKYAIEEKILFRYQTIGESITTQFENKCREFFNVQQALSLHNCTEGLRLSLLATEPKIGDVVYIPAFSFVAVAGAVLSCGLIPKMINVDDKLQLDITQIPKDCERLIVVHMEGSVNELPKNIPYVIEDCAQAMGAKDTQGNFIGTQSFSGVFSFHHNKVLTSGEGGLILTQDYSTWKKMRDYHDHGSNRKHGEYPTWEENCFYGENFLNCEEVAAIQLQQLRHLNDIIQGLQRGYSFLWDRLQERNDHYKIIPRNHNDIKISVRLLMKSHEAREHLIAKLRQKKLAYWTFEKYFLPNHPVLKTRNSIYKDGFPWNLCPDYKIDFLKFDMTRQLLSRFISLPISPELDTDSQIQEADSYAAILQECFKSITV